MRIQMTLAVAQAMTVCGVSSGVADTLTLTYQQGVDGYFGAVDIHLKGGTPDTPAPDDIVWCDYPDRRSSDPVQKGFHGLLRFDLFGDGTAHIPYGADIISATLTITTGSSSRYAQGHGGTFHRMLMPWDESTTWSSFIDGIQADGLEADPIISAAAGNPSLTPKVQPGPLRFDVTADVSAWAQGIPNYGWAILPWSRGTDGWGFWSSEYAAVGARPMLVVEFLPESAEDVVLRMIWQVNDSSLRHRRPLLATLEAALASIERGNSIAAISQLHAFQNKVLAQVHPTDPDLAMELIEGADQAIEALESEEVGDWDTLAALSPIQTCGG